MKNANFLTTLILITIGFSAFAQKTNFPNEEIFTLEGKSVSAEDLNPDAKPLLVLFWDINDKNCLEQILNYNEIYNENLKTKDVRFVAITSNYSGSLYRIKPFVYGFDLDFEVYIDKNGDLKRAMAVPEFPYMVLFDQNMDVFCRYSGSVTGCEDQICKEVKRCLELWERKDDLADYSDPEL